MAQPDIYGLVVQTAPSEEPITTAEAKAQARVSTSDDDTLIGTMITAARLLAENLTNLSFVSTTWDQVLDRWTPGGVIRPARSPLASVTSILYQDIDDTQQTLSTSVYTVDTKRRPGRIYEAEDQSWPDLRGNRNDVTVRFVAGFGAASAVPESIKSAVKLIVAHWYENREAWSPDKLLEVPMAANALLAGEAVKRAG